MSRGPLLSLTGKYLSRHLGYTISQQSYLVKASARCHQEGSRAPFENSRLVVLQANKEKASVFLQR